MMKQSRAEYFKEYRKRNIDRIKEQNKKAYLRRKERLSEEQQYYKELLVYLEQNKRLRIANMSPGRLRRKEQRQQQIYRELLEDNISIS